MEKIFSEMYILEKTKQNELLLIVLMLIQQNTFLNVISKKENSHLLLVNANR